MEVLCFIKKKKFVNAFVNMRLFLRKWDWVIFDRWNFLKVIKKYMASATKTIHLFVCFSSIRIHSSISEANNKCL